MRSRHPVVSRILLLGILVNLLCLMARLGSIPREYNQAADLWCIYSFLTICYCGLSCYIMYRMCRGKKIFYPVISGLFFIFRDSLAVREKCHVFCRTALLSGAYVNHSACVPCLCGGS